MGYKCPKCGSDNVESRVEVIGESHGRQPHIIVDCLKCRVEYQKKDPEQIWKLREEAQ